MPDADTPQLPFFVYGTLKPGEENYLRLLADRTVEETPATLAGPPSSPRGPTRSCSPRPTCCCPATIWCRAC
jgi:hypothetical protein